MVICYLINRLYDVASRLRFIVTVERIVIIYWVLNVTRGEVTHFFTIIYTM